MKEKAWIRREVRVPPQAKWHTGCFYGCECAWVWVWVWVCMWVWGCVHVFSFGCLCAPLGGKTLWNILEGFVLCCWRSWLRLQHSGNLSNLTVFLIFITFAEKYCFSFFFCLAWNPSRDFFKISYLIQSAMFHLEHSFQIILRSLVTFLLLTWRRYDFAILQTTK